MKIDNFNSEFHRNFLLANGINMDKVIEIGSNKDNTVLREGDKGIIISQDISSKDVPSTVKLIEGGLGYDKGSLYENETFRIYIMNTKGEKEYFCTYQNSILVTNPESISIYSELSKHITIIVGFVGSEENQNRKYSSFEKINNLRDICIKYGISDINFFQKSDNKNYSMLLLLSPKTNVKKRSRNLN